jgi:hypothetical protein
MRKKTRISTASGSRQLLFPVFCAVDKSVSA